MKPRDIDYNAIGLNKDTIISYLITGRRTPQNEEEKRWLKSIEECKKKGYIIDIPIF